jgi:hypothetical protein
MRLDALWRRWIEILAGLVIDATVFVSLVVPSLIFFHTDQRDSLRKAAALVDLQSDRIDDRGPVSNIAFKGASELLGG